MPGQSDPRQAAVGDMLKAYAPQQGTAAATPADPREKMIIIQLKSDPKFATLSDEEIQMYARAILDAGGHPAGGEQNITQPGQVVGGGR